MDRPSYLNFDHDQYSWKSGVDYQQHPELYRVGKGEQGVLICEPYKTEIGQHWRFKTPEIARESSVKIFALFEAYLKSNDFVGADMARNNCKWVIRGRVGTPIIKVARNTIKNTTISNWNAVPGIPKKPGQPAYFMSAGKPPKPMYNIYY